MIELSSEGPELAKLSYTGNSELCGTILLKARGENGTSRRINIGIASGSVTGFSGVWSVWCARNVGII